VVAWRKKQGLEKKKKKKKKCEKRNFHHLSGMQSREFSLDLLEVDVDLGPAVVECLLHTVFFVRAFGIVEPVEQELSGLNLWYARVNDAQLELEIRDKVRSFQELQAAGKSGGDIVLSLFEKRVRSSGWFVSSQQEESVCWEKWLIRVRFTGMGARTSAMELSSKAKAVLADEVTRRIHFILKFAKTQQDHIPQVQQQSKSVMPFSFSIDVPLVQSGSMWDNLFKRI
jgi:hypothetical protein